MKDSKSKSNKVRRNTAKSNIITVSQETFAGSSETPEQKPHRESNVYNLYKLAEAYFALHGVEETFEKHFKVELDGKKGEFRLIKSENMSPRINSVLQKFRTVLEEKGIAIARDPSNTQTLIFSVPKKKDAALINQVMDEVEKQRGNFYVKTTSKNVPSIEEAERLNFALRPNQVEALYEALGQKDALIAGNQDSLKRLRKEVLKRNKDLITAAQIRSECFELAEESRLYVPTWLEVGNTCDKGKNHQVACYHWGDIHYGEVVNPIQISGRGIYNPEIAEKRHHEAIDTALQLTSEKEPQVIFDGLVIVALGDIISGGIHEELVKTDEFTSQQAVIGAAQMQIDMVERFLEKFKKVVFVGVVGNHGRSTEGIEHKNITFNSNDWLSYVFVESYFTTKFRALGIPQKDWPVQFYIPENPDAFFSIYNTRVLATHGDRLGVKGGHGEIGPINKIARGANRILRQFATARAAGLGEHRDVDVFMMGHFHMPITIHTHPRIIVNGSLVGYNEYANSGRSPVIPPSQTLSYFNNRRGYLREEIIMIDPEQSDTSNLPADTHKGNVVSFSNQRQTLPPGVRENQRAA